MELTNEFTVEVPIEEAWTVLTDVARIAPCMPGAQLQEVEGDEYRGIVKVKVGPVTAEYRGKATFVERDEAAHRAVLRAEGREARGQGNASATITAVLEPAGTGTKVAVTTDLTITGRVAQFGRGVLADVSNKLLGQFVSCLETTVLAGAVAPAADGGTGPPAAGVQGPAGNGAGTEAGPAGGERDESGDGGPVRSSADSAVPAASVDLLQVAGPAVLKRALPVLGVVVVAWAGWRITRRRRRG